MRVINNEKLDVGDMQGDLLERKPLPIGKTAFMEWSDRILKAAAIEPDPNADLKAHQDSMRFALSGMLMTIGPTEAFKEDAYFALALRASAVKQTAHYMMEEMKEEQKKRLAADTGPQSGSVDAILENKTV